MALSNNPNAIPMPSGEALVLTLICEELKSRRFFNTLMELGLDNSWYQPNLDDLIRQCTGLTDDRNETTDFYCTVMNAHAAAIDIKEETVTAQAREVYGKLIAFRGKARS